MLHDASTFPCVAQMKWLTATNDSSRTSAKITFWFCHKNYFSFSSDFVYEQFTCGKAGRQEATKDTQVTQSNEPWYEADEFVSIAIAGDNWEGENAIESMSRVAFIITFRTPNRLCNVPIICRAQLENYSYCIRLGQKYHDKNVYFIKEQLFALWQ